MSRCLSNLPIRPPVVGMLSGRSGSSSRSSSRLRRRSSGFAVASVLEAYCKNEYQDYCTGKQESDHQYGYLRVRVAGSLDPIFFQQAFAAVGTEKLTGTIGILTGTTKSFHASPLELRLNPAHRLWHAGACISWHVANESKDSPSHANQYRKSRDVQGQNPRYV
jgi:hypothetical protein